MSPGKSSPRWVVVATFVTAAFCLSPAVGRSQAAADFETVDRILAVVDEDPILASDIDRVVGLGLAEQAEGELDEMFRRRILDRLIEERLRFHEIDRFGFTEISLDEVDAGYESIRSTFGARSIFAERLEELGLDAEGLRQLVARQVMVLTYVEERLGPRVFVSLSDIREYYDSTLVPELRARGRQAPPLADVREDVRAVLKELRLNEEIERWTEELRLEADIEDFFDTPVTELPAHVLRTIEEEAQ